MSSNKIYKIVNNTGGNITWGTILISNGSFLTLTPNIILDESAVIADTDQYADLIGSVQSGTVQIQLNDVALSLANAEVWFNEYRNSNGQNVLLYDSEFHQTKLDDPHEITPAQVGNTTAQWNANQIQGLDIFTSIAPTDGQVLTWDAANSRWDAVDNNGVGAVDWIDFNPQSSDPAFLEGRFFYDAGENTMKVYMNPECGLINTMNQANIARGRNETGVTIPKGTVVDFFDVTTTPGGLQIMPAIADNTTGDDRNWALAVTAEEILDGDYGTCAFFGTITGMDTSGLTPGKPAYLSSTVAGELTNDRPNYPGESHLIGASLFSDAVNGVFVAYSKDDNYDYEFDGCILEKQDTTIVVEGTEIYMDVKNTEGPLTRNLPIQLAGTTYSLDTLTGSGTNGAARVQLLQGTSTVPQEQVVYIDITGGVPTLKTTAGYPPVPFAVVAFVTVLDYTTTQSEGPLQHRRLTSSKAHDSRGRISYFTERFSVVSPQYWSGVTPTATINTAPTPDLLDFSVISGIVYQTHRQTFPALSVSGNGIYVANASGSGTLTPYQKLNNLALAIEDTAGNALTANRLHLVVWGAINKTTSECKLFVNLPDDAYGGSDSQAYYDYNGTAVYSVPEELQTVAFLIARIPIDTSSGGNTIAFINPAGQPEIINLLGTPVGVTSGGSGGTGAFIPNLTQVLGVGNSTGNQPIIDLPEVIGTNTNNVIDLQSGISYSTDTSHSFNVSSVGRMFINSSSETLPSTSIANIDVGANRQITTKEWVISKIASIPDPALQAVTDAGSTTTNTMSVTGGTKTMSISNSGFFDVFDSSNGHQATLSTENLTIIDGIGGSSVLDIGRVDVGLSNGKSVNLVVEGVGAKDPTVEFDDGTDIGTLSYSNKFTFNKIVSGVTPVATNDLATKGYADTKLSDAASDGVAYGRKNGTWAPVVEGPASSQDSYIAVFDGTTGKLLKEGVNTVEQINSAINTVASDLTTHENRTDNPHVVTAAQVGNTTAQWNADQLQNRVVTTAAPTDTQVLTWVQSLNGGLGAWEARDASGGTSDSFYAFEYEAIGSLTGQFVVRRNNDSSYNIGYIPQRNLEIVGIEIETGISTATQATQIDIRVGTYTAPNGVQYSYGNGTTLSNDAVFVVGGAQGAQYYRGAFIDKASSPLSVTAGDMVVVDCALNFWNLTDLHVTLFYKEA